METIADIIYRIIDLLRLVVPILFSLAFIYFLYGLYKYMTEVSDEKKRSEAAQFMLYGVIGLFVMISVWGIIYVVGKTFGINSGILPLIVF